MYDTSTSKDPTPNSNTMVAPFIAGVAVAVTALSGRYGIQAWQAFKTRPPKPPQMRKFFEGGFQPTMTRREAAQILGLRESAAPDKVKEAHRRVMVANHPDAGGSHYLASKISEAKDLMLRKTRAVVQHFDPFDNRQVLRLLIGVLNGRVMPIH